MYTAALFGDDAAVSFGSDEEGARPSPARLFGAKQESARHTSSDESSDEAGTNIFG